MPKTIKRHRSRNWLRRLLRREPVPCATGEETVGAEIPNEDVVRILFSAGLLRAPTPEEIATAETTAENLVQGLREARKNSSLTATQLAAIDKALAEFRQAEIYRARRLAFEGAKCLAARLEAFLDREDHKDAENDAQIRKA
jgi:hypothetical protein